MWTVIKFNIQLFIYRLRMCNFNLINLYKYYTDKSFSQHRIDDILNMLDVIYDEEISLPEDEIDFVLYHSPFDNI